MTLGVAFVDGPVKVLDDVLDALALGGVSAPLLLLGLGPTDGEGPV
nr:hypothetical protein [Arthrobacter sp. YN]